MQALATFANMITFIKGVIFVNCLFIFGYARVVMPTYLQYSRTCVNVWDDGCANGQYPGAGTDDAYLGGGFNPGKRCANLWDEGCLNRNLPGSGKDDGYLGGNFNPGKRCTNLWDDGCSYENLPGAGTDDSYLDGNFHPGKRDIFQLLKNKLQHSTPKLYEDQKI